MNWSFFWDETNIYDSKRRIYSPSMLMEMHNLNWQFIKFEIVSIFDWLFIFDSHAIGFLDVSNWYYQSMRLNRINELKWEFVVKCRAHRRHLESKRNFYSAKVLLLNVIVDTNSLLSFALLWFVLKKWQEQERFIIVPAAAAALKMSATADSVSFKMPFIIHKESIGGTKL